MQAITFGFILMVSISTFAASPSYRFSDLDLKDLKVIRYSDLSLQEADEFCIDNSEADADICLMTRQSAMIFCNQKGLKLPSALDFANMAAVYGAYVGKKACGNSRTCQNIRPLSEENFYYNSGGADLRDILADFWFHTSSLREEGANYHFDSTSGFMGSSSDENPGNVVCL